MPRIGIMNITEEALLTLLKFEGGKIRSIHMSPSKEGVIELKLEHPELTEVGPGEVIPTINPQYISHFRKNSRVPYKITREKLNDGERVPQIY